MRQTLELTAPLSGWVVPITEVPDPVFAQKMVGDGIAIDPVSNILLAPCDGIVTQLHSAHHAITITHTSGIEILIHIGLDTITLKGQGFTAHVKAGDLVKTGTPLITFDADYIAIHAVSLLSEIVITNGNSVSRYLPERGRVEAGKSTILTLELDQQISQSVKHPQQQTARSGNIQITNPSGLHARPAAVLANTAKQFQSAIHLIRLNDTVNAKSVVSIMGIEIQYNDQIVVEATGADARQAVDTLTGLIQNGLGENTAKEQPADPPSAPPCAIPVDHANVIRGASASPGLTVGYIVQLRHQDIMVSETGEDSRTEQKYLTDAIAHAHQAIEASRRLSANHLAADKAAIFTAHHELLDDPELLARAMTLINAGKSAAFAWKTVFTEEADKLSRLKSELMAARADDLRDVGRKVLQALTGTSQQNLNLPEQTILVTEELTPSDTVNLDRSKVLGFCTTGGGATSHAAILARALAIPAVAGMDARVLDVADGTPAILDGTEASLTLYPDDIVLQQVAKRQQEQSLQWEADLKLAQEAAITQDGQRIGVVANIGGLSDAEEAVQLGGEGVGLLRSEFLFLHRNIAPNEEEQAAVYISIAKALGHSRPLVVRTLDIGGDKPLAYLPQPREDNPFLGIRGLRLCLAHPELFRTQIRAILKAAPYTQLHIMLPMVTTLEELRAAKKMISEEAGAAGNPEIKTGIMAEVPAVAIMAEQFATEVDFFSIGTNDLTQYTLAMDRGHPKLTKEADGFNPAVLQLISQTVEAAHRHGKWVGVCGGLASNTLAIPVLIGLGVDELSVNVPVIPAIKAQIRHLDLNHCQQLAKEVLALGTAAEIRARLTQQSEG